MSTKTKIKIEDDSELRAEIDRLYEITEQVELAKWSIKCAKHILPLSKVENIDMSDIESGIGVNEFWQVGKASVNQVRKAGFKIHAVARNCKTEIGKNAIRTVGQAVGVGHMKEHAMVCSDYAIKTVQLAFPMDKEKITEERQWQLKALENIKAST
ncbi:putative immunity protein [Flavobacterium hiemivividum]|uniref:Imm-5-like domain-containing protein n=1 Tax=Flavobacterium hiemivividum TaxID=2541734 RepID=A0A4R5D0M9_9FLAO|nr:hypothetical protein [Flavobacterium hiemivividum]TDE04981.1 hypothetical protein E0F98_06470 [Flavobacterium hiemivividum]